MEDFTNRMLGVVNSKSFWIGGILAILFVVGMVPLLLSSRDLEFGSIIRILCVATILTLGIDPILGTLPKGMPRPLSDRWSSTRWSFTRDLTGIPTSPFN